MKNNKPEKTRTAIYNYLNSGYSLTALDAYKKFRTLSLAQHIGALRNQGHTKIITEIKRNEKTGVRFAVYKIK